MLDEFRISSLRLSTSNFLHDDKLFIVTPEGRIGFVAETAGWDPQAVLAQARSIAGLSSNPFERFKLSLDRRRRRDLRRQPVRRHRSARTRALRAHRLLVTGALWWVARILWAKP